MTVISRMTRHAAGIHYVLEVDGVRQWEQFVRFGPRQHRHFVLAAREQDRLAGLAANPPKP